MSENEPGTGLETGTGCEAGTGAGLCFVAKTKTGMDFETGAGCEAEQKQAVRLAKEQAQAGVLAHAWAWA